MARPTPIRAINAFGFFLCLSFDLNLFCNPQGFCFEGGQTVRCFRLGVGVYFRHAIIVIRLFDVKEINPFKEG
ncbi:MAG: hypothetical protein EBS79_08005 [Gammaproteobacteria bacterium]|nr:hypothetical protein [Gammaproteobacteria bacterium]